ncbi:bifunctional aminoglycoside phosphotransferase/ATP-binding protein [Motiliproteus sp. SC1-56]|uniref:bifunctional aminoglycoside phosphotransferase/ATP-binding protein n=1 Tax=Motiliproteus sp. SC1-56 TaxID=2799565 RepID=UPI001A8C3521|nr:bifunctional aminoglycoside phosphotransferase/ATP-binding protein [Motiliproteus sp. SC1-56]
MASSLIDALSSPAPYPHPVDHVKIIETHISWVLLAGDYAYKIRKPVNFGFLDFTSLEKRRFDCEEELRLNRRLSPDLYLGLVTLNGCLQQPVINADGPVLEYAVQMRRFRQKDLLSRQQEQGRLSHTDIKDLAAQLARFHQRAPAASPHSAYGGPEALAAAVQGNFETADARLPAKAAPLRQQLQELRQWSEKQLADFTPLILERRVQRRVREGHGDLHLGNIARIDERLCPFDCLEFNPALRWVDCLNDLAFLLMDLEHRDEGALAQQLLDAYLQITGDFSGMPLLPLFKAYRAMVRAKVALLEAHEQDSARLEIYRRYAALAAMYAAPRPPRLVLMHGVSGSGKSWLSSRLLEHSPLGFVRLRSDVERKRLCGDAPGGLYSADSTRRTYTRLLELARMLLQAGRAVIVDATFLKHAQRRPFLQLAEELDLPAQLLCCRASEAVLDARIQARQLQNRDPSDATPSVRRMQMQQAEPLRAAEQHLAWAVNTGDAARVAWVEHRLGSAQTGPQSGGEASSS